MRLIRMECGQGCHHTTLSRDNCLFGQFGQSHGCMEFNAYDNLTNCPGHLKGIEGILVRVGRAGSRIAGVAQVVEHLICNQRVGGSNPFASSSNTTV